VTSAKAITVSATTAARRVLAERSGLLVSVGFYVAVVSVVASLWRTAAAANDGAVAGYTAVALTWYIAASEAATVSLNIRLIEDIGTDIANGSVVVELLRPASMVGVRIASEVGRALPRVAALGVVGVAVAFVVSGGHGPPGGAGVLLAAPALLLAIMVNVVAQHAFAGVAFWIRDARSTWFLYQKFVFIVGGMLLPLEVLPDGLERAAKALPFMAMAYAPGRIAAGHFEPELLLVQLGWLGVLGALATAVFAAGERRLQAVGG
jgi:ABC-2 type transport system permease protein